MKKRLSFLLALILATTLLAACDSGPDIPPPDHPLIGIWAWDENTAFEYVFESTGEGTRGVLGANVERFIWSVSGGGVTIYPQGEGDYEIWNYAVDGRVLTLTDNGTAYVYIQAYVETTAQDGPLVGTWAWDGNPAWEYVFGSDGQGTRGTGGNLDSFEWWTTGDGVLLMHLGPRVDRWSYSINGDILTLVSQQETGVEFHYIRVA